MNTQNYGRRDFMKAIGLAAVLGVPGCRDLTQRLGGRPTPSYLPNFVIIFCDDVGYADVGCYGTKGFETPNLDRMAAEGMRFTDFYVAAPSCTPSRAALLMGCYPQRVSLPRVLFPEGPPRPKDLTRIGINSKETTIAEILKRRGYATACFGKWHLGHHRQFLPTRHGFDEYVGLPYSNDMRPEKNKEYPPLPLMKGESVIESDPDQSKLTALYTEEAVKFIEKNKDKPFFVYVPHSMAHVPLYVSEKFKGKSKQGMYGDVMMEIDWSAGQILSALKRLGIDERTLVIFTSDNGPWLAYGDHGGSALPLREGKGTTWEGGMREPCIMRWPGKIPAGAVCSELSTAMDILPTFANLAGAKLPRKHIDGKDIWPLMSGEPGAGSPHEAFFYYRYSELQAVRSGRWKLHFPHEYRTLAGGSGGEGGKSVEYEHERVGLELFDLQSDIGETTNIADKYPGVVERLKRLADTARKDLGDTLYNVKGKNVRKPGRI
ncbi:MAG: sulfatase family protein [Planctomycetota bacterium]|jgi:arylsulfatase A